MPAVRRPKRGSRGFYPRGRASRSYPRITSWPIVADAKVLGFAGYKAGMTHVMLIDNNPNSRTKGQLVSKSVTVLDCPPLTVLGFKCHANTVHGKKEVASVTAEKADKNLSRKWGIQKIRPIGEQLKAIEGKRIDSVMLTIRTNPGFKKTPEVFEVAIGGAMDKQLEFAKSMVGKEIKASDVLKQGDLVDVFAVSKGKGFQGPVKRFGIHIQGRKFQQMHRHTGALGTTEPGKIRHTVPAAGQHGFQSRMEWNKCIIKVGGEPKEVTPAGHFLRYGILHGEPVLIEGSVPGPTKRLIRLRSGMRLPKSRYAVELKSINTGSKQGVRVQ